MAEKKYIEREVLLNFLRNTYDIPLETWTARNYWSKVVEIKDKFISCIEKLPAADVAPVVHGEWKLHDNGDGTCNQCHFRQKLIWDYDNWQNYCGVCGARMDGERKEATP